MKKGLSLVSALLLLIPAFGQRDQSGVYLSAEDFQSQRLSFGVDNSTFKHKIKLNDFWGKPYITVYHNNSTYQLNKAGVFGYRTRKGDVVRFLGKKELFLLNPGESLLLYKRVFTKSISGKTNVTNYYFSKDALSPAMKLTVSNLKKVFAGDAFFLAKLAEQFQYNSELVRYNDYRRMYALNWILHNSRLHGEKP